MLGGSFNPAHAGHRHIAELALRRLRLDQVWLLVSPGNPLKPERGMAPLSRRFAGARALSDGRRVVATAVEGALGTRFTVDTLRALLRRFPFAQFVWIMGADLVEQLPRWRRWHHMLQHIPVAVLPRPGYNHRALASKAAKRMRHARQSERAAATLPGRAPGWVFLHARENPISASAIRATRKGGVS